MKITFGLFFFFLFLLLPAPEASAHKLMADALVHEDGSVWIDAFFADGSPAKQIKVEIFRPDGSLYGEGKTDDQGRFALAPSGPSGTWKAVVSSALGHRAEAAFDLKELGERPAPQPEAAAPSALSSKQAATGEASSKQRPSLRGEPFPWEKVFSGLGFLLGLSAFLLSCYLFKEVKELKDALAGD